MNWPVVLGLAEIARRSEVRLLLSAWLLSAATGVAAAGGPNRAQAPGSKPLSDNGFRTTTVLSPAEAAAATAPEIEIDSAEVRTDGPAVAGATMRLSVGSGTEQETRYQWVQTGGPTVAIDDPTKASIQIVLPGGAAKLEFLVVMARPAVVHVLRVTVPLQSDAASHSWGARPSGKVKADAGDDQIGLIGRRVTLNGSRSSPADGKNGRWLQVEGPPIGAPEQQGHCFSFVPSKPGLYRFLLIVAGDGEVSEPDEVTVLVGSPPTDTGGAPMPVASATTPALASPPVPAPDQILGNALPKLPNGIRVASDVADVMEAISERAALYSSFAELQQELARRLDLVVPSDPADRMAWNHTVFSPLTAYTSSQLLAAGMDVRQSQGLQQPLTAAQQDRVREHFQRLARAFCAALPSR